MDHADPAPGIRCRAGGTVVLALLFFGPSLAAAAERAVPRFDDDIRPILEDRCFTCYGNGIKKGGVDLESAAAGDHKLWWAVLKNLRAGIMPPADKPQPSGPERQQLEDWIKFGAFGINADDPDPGRITV